MKRFAVIRTALFFAGLAVILAFEPGHTALAATLELAPSGEGVFVIRGTGLKDAGAIDLTVTYDASSLANPRVVQGDLISGAMMAVNDKTPGAVRLGIISVTPIQGTGVIAMLTFDRKSGRAGKMPSLVVKKISSVNGDPLTVTAGTSPAEAAVEAPGSSQKAATEQTAATAASVAAAAPSPAPAGLLAPGGVILEEKKNQSASPEEAAPAAETTTAMKEPVAASAGPKGITASLEPQRKKAQQFASVLERFRTHKKERTEKTFLSLFEQVEASGFRQEPQVVLADGKATARILIVVPASSGAPDFALRGARLLSVRRDAERSNTWVIEAKPDKGEYEASLLVSRDDVILEYPLTLAPEVKLVSESRPATDDDFKRYLRGKGKDINGDGKIDYLDDYIFTANFIAGMKQ